MPLLTLPLCRYHDPCPPGLSRGWPDACVCMSPNMGVVVPMDPGRVSRDYICRDHCPFPDQPGPHGHTRDAAGRPLPGPSLAERAWSFVRALCRHVRNWCAKTSARERLRRLEICRGCEHWGGSVCRLCGCRFGLKLTWKSEHCPHPGGARW